MKFWARRITAREQKATEKAYTKKGEADYHGMTDHLLSTHITGWEAAPDPIRLGGQDAPFSCENLLRLPLDVRNDVIGKLYEASPDQMGNSSAGSLAATPHAG